MTNGVACPDPLLLSQFLDHELEAAEESRIIDHLKFCLDCQSKVNRLEKAKGQAHTLLFSQRQRLSSLPTPSASCPPPEKIAAYMQSEVTANEDQQIEQHLQSCEACFHEAKEAARIVVFLASPQTPPVPAALKAQVEAQWETSATPNSRRSLPRLIIELTKQGLRLIESYLAPPLLVEKVPVPGRAYRGGKHSPMLNLRLHTRETEVYVLATLENEGVSVRLTLLSSERKALANRRIDLRQQGRMIFSAQTDQEGVLHVVPRLEPGEYEVSCHEIETTFQLELRS